MSRARILSPLPMLTLALLAGCASAPKAGTPGPDAKLEAAYAEELAPATPEEIAEIERADALTRANFWAGEFRKDPTNLDVTIRFTSVLREIGSHERAIDVLTKTIPLHPKSDDLQLIMGRALLSQNRTGEAAEAFYRASVIAPGNAAAHAGLGVAFDRLERHHDAQNSYRAALEIEPQRVSTLTNYGLSLALSGDLTGAEQQLRMAALFGQPPVLQHQNAVGDVQRETEHLFRHHNGQAFLVPYAAQSACHILDDGGLNPFSGLIQQQQIGLAEQQRRQGNAHPPTAGKIVAGLLLGLFAEPQPGQDAGGAGGRRMGALVMQPVMDFGDPVRIGGGFGLRHQVGQFCITAKHRVDQALPPARRFLRGNPDPPGGRRLGGAAVGVQGTGDQPQQGGLARSVAPDQANPVAGIDRRCRPVKQGPGADLVSDVIDPQHRNSPIRFVDRG